LAAPGIFLGAVGQFAWQRQALEGALADHQLAGFASRFAGARGGKALLDDAPAIERVFGQKLVEPSIDDGLHRRANLGVVELGLGLALELRVEHLDAHYGGPAFANIVTPQVRLSVL